MKLSSLKYIPLTFWAAFKFAAYLNRWGYWRSLLTHKVVDSLGKPLPWMTYPAIEFLSAQDFSQASVLEFGAGNSTLWWQDRCKSVETVELDTYWRGWLTLRAKDNVTLHYQAHNGPFDVVVIDGGDRAEHCRNIKQWIKPTSIIVLDNADWYPQLCELLCNSLPNHKIMHLCGLAPMNPVPHATAIFIPTTTGSAESSPPS